MRTFFLTVLLINSICASVASGMNSMSLLKNKIRSVENHQLKTRKEYDVQIMKPSRNVYTDRGGSSLVHRKHDVDTRDKVKSTTKLVTFSAIGILTTRFIFQNRHKFPSKNGLQNHALSLATTIKKKGCIGVFYYVSIVACLELFGISSSVLEISGK